MKIAARLIPVLLVPVLVGCGDDEPAAPVELDVTVQGWTGAQREQPAPTTRTVTLGEDESFAVDVAGGEVVVTIIDIDDEIRLETSRKMAPRGEGGGINLNDTTDDFSLDRDGQVEFSTPTMDGGTTVTVAQG